MKTKLRIFKLLFTMKFFLTKNPLEILEKSIELESSVQNASVVFMYPEDDSLSSELSFSENKVIIKFTGGVLGTTYSLKVVVEEVEKQESLEIIVLVKGEEMQGQNDFACEGFMDTLERIQAGGSAVSNVIFKLPCDVETQNGYVTWELIDNNSNVLSQGNAHSYEVTNDGINNSVSADCLITVPSSVPPTLQNTRYQIRYCLRVGEREYYQFEALKVEGTFTVPVGIQDTVELQGTKTCMQIVTPYKAQSVVMEIYYDNELLTSLDLTQNTEQVATGWKYGGNIDTNTMKISLENYTVVFKYVDDKGDTFQENAKLYIVNPSILSAARDILEKINKARTTLYGAPDLVYTMPCILTWLRRGGDRFNGSYGIFTNFTFTNAKGGVREYWLMWAELMALESQYLAEGEKAFDFQGAAISLNVDRTQYLEAMREKLQGALDNEFKPFKQNLLIKGNTSGDGSNGNSSGVLAPGSMGAIGITITPATGWGRYYPGNYYTKWF